MIKSLLVLTAGFFCAGIAASLLGLVEPIWAGKGVIAFAYPLVIFLVGEVAVVIFYRRRLVMSSNSYGPSPIALLIIGALSYRAVDYLTGVFPDFAKEVGLFSLVGPFGVVQDR